MEIRPITLKEALDGKVLHIARSEFLDAFAELELVVLKILKSSGATAKGEPFSQKVKSFRSVNKTSLIAKANFPQRDILADDICTLLRIRADIVHSRMTICEINGVLAASFINVNEAGTPYPATRILDQSQLKQLTAEATRLVRRIGQLNKTNPASSPQPPSPDAAGGL